MPNDDWKYQCERCGEICSNTPCPKPWVFGWVHRDPNVCIKYVAERTARETEARVRKELEDKAKVPA